MNYFGVAIRKPPSSGELDAYPLEMIRNGLTYDVMVATRLIVGADVWHAAFQTALQQAVEFVVNTPPKSYADVSPLLDALRNTCALLCTAVVDDRDVKAFTAAMYGMFARLIRDRNCYVLTNDRCMQWFAKPLLDPTAMVSYALGCVRWYVPFGAHTKHLLLELNDTIYTWTLYHERDAKYTILPIGQRRMAAFSQSTHVLWALLQDAIVEHINAETEPELVQDLADYLTQFDPYVLDVEHAE